LGLAEGASGSERPSRGPQTLGLSLSDAEVCIEEALELREARLAAALLLVVRQKSFEISEGGDKLGLSLEDGTSPYLLAVTI